MLKYEIAVLMIPDFIRKSLVACGTQQLLFENVHKIYIGHVVFIRKLDFQ
jgi:hypothetical protein